METQLYAGLPHSAGKRSTEGKWTVYVFHGVWVGRLLVTSKKSSGASGNCIPSREDCTVAGANGIGHGHISEVNRPVHGSGTGDPSGRPFQDSHSKACLLATSGTSQC